MVDNSVQKPLNPHNQTTMDDGDHDPASISDKIEEQYVLNSLFTGGFNRETQAHLIDTLIESEPNFPQMAGANKGSSSSCAMPECQGKVMRDERGEDILPCNCGFKICRDCYNKAVKTGRGICPGCKQPYDQTKSKVQMVSSFMIEPLSAQTSSQTDDDNLGNATDDETASKMKPWRPLTQKIKPPVSILAPYCLVIFVRFVALALFLGWRITHPNHDAIWLWGMSVVCEIWFAFSWLLDQLPKLRPTNRSTDLDLLKEKFERPNVKSDLPGIDVFVTTADPEKEPSLVTSNTILSVLAVEYPVEKLACYVSDDGGSLITYEAMAETAKFANIWVPFCRKHEIEFRNPEVYFDQKRKDRFKNKVKPDFVNDRQRVKREYDEFKVRINNLPDSIRRRSDAKEEAKTVKNPKATWMAGGTRWPGTWLNPVVDHSRGDHAGIIQVMLKPPNDDPLHGTANDSLIDLSNVDIRLPLLVYLSREKRPGYDHNKKAGAMNALVRASAIMSNGPFILNLDCDHYIYNSQSLREGICFMMDRGGDRISYVQFPQRFDGIDPCDRYANRNTVFFDVNMRALDGLMGPFYVGTGCLFRRIAVYGFDPARLKEYHPSCYFLDRRNSKNKRHSSRPHSHTTEEELALRLGDSDDDKMNITLFPEWFGNSKVFIDSIKVAEYQGRPLADHPSVKNGRKPGDLTFPRKLLNKLILIEAINVISCWYEDMTEWGYHVGWVYGSITEDVVTGYKMHNRGWKSVYCVTKRDAFRGTAPINLTDRLHQVLRWATGSIEIFFSPNNAFLASRKMKLLQRIAYLNVGMYPFTSIFLIVYCFVPALSLFSGQFIVQTVNVAYLIYLLMITVTLCLLSLLEIKWSGIELEALWRNEQFWMIAGTSSHFNAVLQGLLKAVSGVEISFNLTSKSSADDEDDEFAELYMFKWTPLMIPPIMLIMVNIIAIAVGFGRAIYSEIPQWSRILGGVFFSFWVLAHLYPFAQGLMGRGKPPTIVYLWSGLIAIIISLLCVAVNSPLSNPTQIGGSLQFLK